MPGAGPGVLDKKYLKPSHLEESLTNVCYDSGFLPRHEMHFVFLTFISLYI